MDWENVDCYLILVDKKTGDTCAMEWKGDISVEYPERDIVSFNTSQGRSCLLPGNQLVKFKGECKQEDLTEIFFAGEEDLK